MAAKKIAEFMIVNRRTGKALQASGQENGQAVVQAAPTGEDSQLWTQEDGENSLKLVNKGNQKVLDVMQGGTENGAWAQTWDDVGGESQQWQIVKVTATYKKLWNVHSGKVLDIVHMSDEEGAAAQIWEDVDGVGQQWKFVPARKDEAPKTATKTVRKPAAKRAAKAAEKAAPLAEASAEELSKKTGAKAAARKAPAKGKK